MLNTVMSVMFVQTESTHISSLCLKLKQITKGINGFLSDGNASYGHICVNHEDFIPKQPNIQLHIICCSVGSILAGE